MHKIEVPLDYKPKFELCWRKDRNRFTLTYLVPGCSKKTSITMPEEITTAKQAEIIKDRKNTDLLKGILTEKEYRKFKEDRGSAIVSFEDGFLKYKSIDIHLKGKKTQESDSYCVQKSLKWFQDLETTNGNKRLKKLTDIEQDHIVEYRTFLLSEAQMRKLSEESFRKKSSKIKDPEVFNEMKKLSQSVGISYATAETKLRRLFTFFNKLNENKILNYNPCKEVKKITPKTSDKVRSNSPTTSEIGQILNAKYVHRYGFPIKELIIFLAETGARWGEALHFEFSDIENGIWKIREKPNCPTRYGIGWSPKFGRSRNVALTPKALSVIDRLQVLKSDAKVVGYITGDDTPYDANFAFTIKDYGRHNDGGRRRVDSAKKAWKSLLKTAGVRAYSFESINFHDFRRYRNEMNDKVKGMTATERGKELGNSERVNKSHYTGQLDDEVLQMAAEIRALKEEVVNLKEEKEALTLSFQSMKPV